MSYRLHKEHKLSKSVRSIICRQIDKAAESLETVREPSSEGIHDARKSFKKIRAVLRLIRPSIEQRYKDENVAFRDYGRSLADWRDAKVLPVTLDQLKDHFGEKMKVHFFYSARKKLEESFSTVMFDSTRLHSTIEEIRNRLSKQKKQWKTLPLKVSPEDIVGGAQKIYHKGQKAYETAYANPTGANFHQWRKQVKYHWYHLRLLHDIWPSYMGELENLAHELASLLGSEHDLTILREKLISLAPDKLPDEDMALLLDLIDIQQKQLRDRARGDGMRLFAGEPADFAKRLTAYIDAFKSEEESGW